MNFSIGFAFASKHFGGRIEVLGVDRPKNNLSVHLTKPYGRLNKGFSTWVEVWDLKMVDNGFSNGDYFFKYFENYPTLLKSGIAPCGARHGCDDCINRYSISSPCPLKAKTRARHFAY